MVKLAFFSGKRSPLANDPKRLLFSQGASKINLFKSLKNHGSSKYQPSFA